MTVRTARLILFSIFVIVIAPVLLVIGALHFIRSSACTAETELKIANLSGFQFLVSDTSCDLLAKDEAVSVYVAHADSSSPFARIFHKKTLLFRYDPGTDNSPTPSIQVSPNNKILISVPNVSSVLFQSKKWENMTVDYNIGKMDYPASAIK